jgi:hypothetical protein
MKNKLKQYKMARFKVITKWADIKKNKKLIISSDGLNNDEIKFELNNFKGGWKLNVLNEFVVKKVSNNGIYLKPKGSRETECYIQKNKISLKDFILVI